MILVVIVGLEQIALCNKNYLNNAENFYLLLNAELSADYLCRGVFYNPDPCLSIYVHPNDKTNHCPHHQQLLKTSVCRDTVKPIWENEVRGIYFFVVVILY